MLNNEEETKQGKLAMFDGRQRNFVVWEEKFIARAYKKKFADVLLGKVTVPKFKEDYDNEENKPDDAMTKIIEMNIMAYGDLVNSIDTNEESGRTAFRLI